MRIQGLKVNQLHLSPCEGDEANKSENHFQVYKVQEGEIFNKYLES